MTEHRFTIEDALSLLESADGDYDDGIDASVGVLIEGGTAVVELSAPETPEDDQFTVIERFRVTVERIEPTDTTKEN